MIALPGWAWALGGALLGAIVGSFLATMAVRWPRGRSVSAGRSQCDGCGRTLAWFELVPLASALVLRGRCRTCGAGVAPVHAGVELAAALIGASAFGFAPGWSGLAWSLFGWTLLVLAVLDLTDFWLPDRLTLPLLALGLGAGGWASGADLPDRLIGAAAGWAVLWLVAWSYRRLRGREGLGAGDAKLLGAIGAWLGWAALPFVLTAAGLVGLVAVGIATLRGRVIGGAMPIPFGAALCVAAWPGWWLLQTLRS